MGTAVLQEHDAPRAYNQEVALESPAVVESACQVAQYAMGGQGGGHYYDAEEPEEADQSATCVVEVVEQAHVPGVDDEPEEDVVRLEILQKRDDNAGVVEAVEVDEAAGFDAALEMLVSACGSAVVPRTARGTSL